MTEAAPYDQRLATVAAWDVPLVRGAAATMSAMADRLRSWRARLEGVGRSLASERTWAGPSARSAGRVLDEVAAAAWAVDAAMADSAAAFTRLADEASAAQASAVRSYSLPAGRLGAVAAPESASAAREEALERAAAAGAAAEAAGTALAVPAGPLAAPLAPGAADAGTALGAPAGARPPAEVAAWWAALPAAVQLALLHRAPAVLGGLDGLPAWARDRANRGLLRQALADPRLSPAASATAAAVAARLREEEALGRVVQLHLLDLEEDLVALALGDLDSAEAVAVLVPGIANSPADDLDGLTGNARDVGTAARAAAPGLTVATMVWLGYGTPHTVPSALSRTAAWRGGAALAKALAGLADARGAVGRPLPRTTVLAHSYGTVLVDEAADVRGRLAADAVVLLGSPGMEDDAAGLEVPEVYDVASAADLVTYAAWFGISTRAEAFGSTPLPRDPGTGHSDHYERGSATLAGVGEVVGAPWTPP
ncbi:alpha/beta hydrolase [Blastococcus sp. PRF04-17]|uniref:alpha/beta hydrolase n=1 Tax=Blastococcus sp. PRF04-17 TaxID=2933797 RepID=UPI001FF3DAAF|nr:alpha/beta hydrolase [Blastococcus sp. PRF04-17]UOY00034.1 alpha/beta hydrolase family protein [Blastococcus sp. PRF04-17]